MADVVEITEFTDPACPYSYNAEPLRWRLLWRYEDHLDWTSRMVVLSDRPEDYTARGLTPQLLAQSAAALADEHGMPTDSRPKIRPPATRPACTAVVAVREHVGRPQAHAILRALRVRSFSGELLDDDDTIAAAAVEAGLDAPQVLAWMRDPDVVAAVEDDRATARRPSPAASVLSERLTCHEGACRYACPSLELVRRSDGLRMSAPGFLPGAVHDVLLANLLPRVARREPPASAEDVLRWAGVPLATVEVAAVRDVAPDEARDELARVAQRRDVGRDGFWSLVGG